jgi:hypothetical protein
MYFSGVLQQNFPKFKVLFPFKRVAGSNQICWLLGGPSTIYSEEGPAVSYVQHRKFQQSSIIDSKDHVDQTT